MAIARHDTGVGSAWRALASQVHPVFMLPPVASSLFGGFVSGEFSLAYAGLHVIAAFAGLYTAHVKDGYVDFYLRGEDESHPLTAYGCKVAIGLASAVFLVTAVAIGIVVGPVAAAITLPGWFIGYLHAPQFDMNPITATIGYPSGVGLAMIGGCYVQVQTITPPTIGYAFVFTTILIGMKTIDDAKDYEYDRSIGKRTVAVVLGRRRSRQVAYVCMGIGLSLTALLAGIGLFPVGAALGVPLFGSVAAFTVAAGPERSTMLLIRASYVFLAVLVATAWFRPLS